MQHSPGVDRAGPESAPAGEILFYQGVQIRHDAPPGQTGATWRRASRTPLCRYRHRARIQAPDRAQPAVPTGLGYVAGYTHDHIRHGTATLCAAPSVAAGMVIVRWRKRNRHQEWLAILRLIDRETPEGPSPHLVVDNDATQEHAKALA